MGRGRRPNLALEPTRALQTQRAFRQRKAEHLANLEQSVKALTDENAKLRRMLHLEPASPRLSSDAHAEPNGSGSAGASPSSSAARGTPDVQGKPDRTCEGCAPVHEANRQLGVAAAQVEAQMRGLQQTLKALRSVLAQHNIALPSPLGLAHDDPPPHPQPPQAVRQTKRARVDGAPPQLPPLYAPDSDNHNGGYTPSGVHMTSHYYAPSPHEAYRRTHASASTTAGTPGSAWHTPSPSAILSAPTPPSASFSPRHSYAAYPSPNPHTATAGEEGYYKRMPTRQNSGSTSTSNSGSGGSGGGGRPQLPQLASLSPARQSSSLPQWSQSQPPPTASPASFKRHYEPPPPATAASDRLPSKCCPAPTTSASGSGNGSANGSGCGGGKAESRNWDAPPPLGVSFDMRGAGRSPSTAENNGATKAVEEGDDECCFGLVKCDDEGRIVI